MRNTIDGVNSTGPLLPSTSSGAATATSGQAGVAADAAVSAGDVADVAQTEALLQSIAEAANNAPGVDADKVANLQQAIASGAYQTDPQSIAQKIVELETLLGTAGQVQ